MSWLDKIKTELTITCGDGKEYKPTWLNARFLQEYNVTVFNFNNVSGSLVKRKQPKGRRFEIELYFQGENHLDIAEAFQVSSANVGAWTMQHPFYKELLVQPTGLIYDNSVYNLTKVTGTIIETISEEVPRSTLSPIDIIPANKIVTDTALATSYTNDIVPTATDVQEMLTTNATVYELGKKAITNTENFEGYYNAFKTANSSIENAITAPSTAINNIQSLISYPAKFKNTVDGRIKTLLSQLTALGSTISASISKSSKKYYETTGGTVLSTIASTTVTNTSTADYNNRTVILGLVDTITAAYDSYLLNLDTLQTSNGYNPDSYIPNATALHQLSSLVNYAIANLFTIAATAKQERTYKVPEDTNLILLTAQLYGLNNDDSNIELLMQQNSIGINEIISIKKGRNILHYV